MAQKNDIAPIERELGELSTNIKNLGQKIDALNDTIEKVKDTYVRKDDIALLKTIVFGTVGFILTSVFSGIAYFFTTLKK